MAFVWSARTVGALVIGITILSVSLFNIGQAFSNIDEESMEVDVRRVAQMVEVIDHRPGTTVEITFDESYSVVELAEDQVAIEYDGRRLSQDIRPFNDIETGSLSDTDTICLVNDGGSLSLTDGCGLQEGDGDDTGA